jgi:hypothetical protein
MSLCVYVEKLADMIGIDLIGAVDEDGLWSWIHELGGAHEGYGKAGMLEVMVTVLRILGTIQCEEAGLAPKANSILWLSVSTPGHTHHVSHILLHTLYTLHTTRFDNNARTFICLATRAHSPVRYISLRTLPALAFDDIFCSSSMWPGSGGSRKDLVTSRV